jgi:hypothetical protein
MSEKDLEQRKMQAALNAIADKIKNGHLLASTDRVEFLETVARRLSEQSKALEEARAELNCREGVINKGVFEREALRDRLARAADKICAEYCSTNHGPCQQFRESPAPAPAEACEKCSRIVCEIANSDPRHQPMTLQRFERIYWLAKELAAHAHVKPAERAVLPSGLRPSVASDVSARVKEITGETVADEIMEATSIRFQGLSALHLSEAIAFARSRGWEPKKV